MRLVSPGRGTAHTGAWRFGNGSFGRGRVPGVGVAGERDAGHRRPDRPHDGRLQRHQLAAECPACTCGLQALWWVAVFCTGLVGTTVLMVVRAARTKACVRQRWRVRAVDPGRGSHRAMGVAGGAHRTRTMDLVAYRTILFAPRSGRGPGARCTGPSWVFVSRCFGPRAPGSADFRTAISQGLFAPTAALAIAAVALGMLKAARRADDLAQAALAGEAAAAMDRALAAEREDLDRLVHDDVLTTLTAAAHAQDGAAVEATKSLASATLGKLGEPVLQGETDGAVTLSGLVELARASALQVSPAVLFGAALPESLGRNSRRGG